MTDPTLINCRQAVAPGTRPLLAGSRCSRGRPPHGKARRGVAMASHYKRRGMIPPRPLLMPRPTGHHKGILVPPIKTLSRNYRVPLAINDVIHSAPGVAVGLGVHPWLQQMGEASHGGSGGAARGGG